MSVQGSEGAPRATAPRRGIAWIWVGVLALTATSQFYRGAPFDGTVFSVFAGLLALEALGVLPNIRPVRAPSRAVLALLALGSAVVLIVTPFDGPISRMLLMLIGAASVAYFWPQDLHEPQKPNEAHQKPPDRKARREARHPATREKLRPPDEPAPNRNALRRTAALWAVLAVLVCLWELAAFLLGGSSPVAELAHPTISSLIEPFVASTWGRPVFVVLWVAGGLVLLRISRAAMSRTAMSRAATTRGAAR